MNGRRTLATTVSCVTTCALVLSFGLHSIQVVHDHPGHMSSLAHLNESGGHTDEAGTVLVLGEYMHQADKKLLFLLMSALLLSTLLAILLFGSWRRYMSATFLRSRLLLRELQHRWVLILYAFEIYIQRGLLHPQCH